MKQNTHWQLRQIRLLSQHVAEQKCLLATHEAAREWLRQQQQQSWTGLYLSKGATLRLLIEQAVERQGQQGHQGQQWQTMRHRHGLEERILLEQIEQEQVRQN